MERPPDSIAARAGRAVVACVAALVLAIVMTWPLATGMGRLGRSRGGGDGLYSVWNVAWVARTLVVDPLHLYDANIFYPHRHALAFSEANIGAGVIGIPAWLLTGNAYTAHNNALLAAFATAMLGMWLLTRHLTGSSAAGAIAGMLYGFCPYMFSHTPHIQLLMSGGLPLAMLAFHRLADAPSARRGAALGLALTLQALSSAYYGIFAGLMVAYASLLIAAMRGTWRDVRYWTALAVGAVTAMVIVFPFFVPYLDVQQQGFRRTIGDAARYSANAQSYIASPTHAHNWMLGATSGWTRWTEVLFPGFLAVGLGIAGFAVALSMGRARSLRSAPSPFSGREIAVVYGSLGLLAFWASFGPSAGLYSLLFHLPTFSLLRAPSRFGLIVVLSLAVFSGFAIAALLQRMRAAQRPVAAAALALIAVIELNVLPFPWERAEEIPAAYEKLAQLPSGPVAEFPFYWDRPVYHLHTQYMIFSTAHWMPMLNGYSDHIPQDFREATRVFENFPSKDSFALLEQQRVRYIGVHFGMYGPRGETVRRALEPYLPYLRPIGGDAQMMLYEIVGYP